METKTEPKSLQLEHRHLHVEPNGYGGKQAWLSEIGGHSKHLANRACGVTAVANVSLYLARTRPACRNLYPYEVATKENFTQVMTDVLKHLKPTPAGIINLGMLTRGFQNYAKEKGVVLNGNASHWKWTKSNVEQYIRSGLHYQSPVLLLTWNSRISELKNHWVIVTGMNRDETGKITITTSNWGYKREYSLDEWVKHFSLYRGLYYFT